MRSLSLVTVTLLVALAAGPGALAQSGGDAKAEAKRYFDAGVTLLKAEDYGGAAASFEASVKTYPTKTALFNLANCYKALNRYDDALATLFRLRRDFADTLDEEMLTVAKAIETEIKNLVGTLWIEVDRPGATVLVDGRELGTSPTSRLFLLGPGDHEVTARLKGVEFGVEKVKMLPGEEQVVKITGEERSSEVPSQPPPQTAVPDEAQDRGGLHQGWFWGGLAATAVLGGATIGVTAAVKKDIDSIADEDEESRVDRMQVGGITLLALTGVAAVTTAVLALFTDWGGESDEHAVAPTAWATDTGAGFGLTGRF